MRRPAGCRVSNWFGMAMRCCSLCRSILKSVDRSIVTVAEIDWFSAPQFRGKVHTLDLSFRKQSAHVPPLPGPHDRCTTCKRRWQPLYGPARVCQFIGVGDRLPAGAVLRAVEIEPECEQGTRAGCLVCAQGKTAQRLRFTDAVSRRAGFRRVRRQPDRPDAVRAGTYP